MNKSQDWPFSHDAPAHGKNGPSYASTATPVCDRGYSSPQFSGSWLTRPRAVTRVHLGEYSGHFLQGASAPFIPDLESPVEESDTYDLGHIHDGFHDEREPLDGDEYVRLVHRWNAALAVVLIVIFLGLVLVGGR